MGKSMIKQENDEDFDKLKETVKKLKQEVERKETNIKHLK